MFGFLFLSIFIIGFFYIFILETLPVQKILPFDEEVLEEDDEKCEVQVVTDKTYTVHDVPRRAKEGSIVENCTESYSTGKDDD
jgi:NADPH-dependent ferric siderophore reductase